MTAATPGQGGPPPRTSRYPTSPLALIGALLGSLAIVAFIVMVVVRPDGLTPARVDWHAAAAESNDPRLIAPDLPDGWTANYAELEGEGDVAAWRIGFLSPTNGFVGMSLALESTEDWIELQHDEAEATGSETIGGLRWETIDRRTEEHVGNRAFIMIATLDGGDPRAVALYGTASDEDFRTVAASVGQAVAP
ncbi:MAG: DUF4245 domain-containing protein [Microbacteriaceae bacterium]|nr:DUF4245 domain-containing protein [Microbacteriaceae bacterium]